MLHHSENDYHQKSNNQGIIHKKINNYNPLKEFIINLNGIVNNNNNYKRSLSPILPSHKNRRNRKDYLYLQNELNNNSFTQVKKQNYKIISIKIKNPIKPYKKKSVLFNPNKSKEKNNNFKLDLTNYSESINSNSITDRTFEKTKISFLKEEDSSFLNIIDNNTNNNIFENQIKENKPINNSLYKNKNVFTSTNCNTSLKTNKKLCRKIPLSKKNLPIKNFKINRNNCKKDIIPNINISINNKYNKRFNKILILLIEKYFKTYLLKIKYSFINNLKLYKKEKTKSIKAKKNNIQIFFNTNYLTDRNNESRNSSFYNTKYKTINENILIQHFKNENKKNSSDKDNFIELFRNKKELFKKEIIISRRKESKSKSKSKEKHEKIIKKNKSIDNVIKLKKNNYFYNKTKPLLIIKKLKTSDNRINIDIKYLGQISKNKKKIFRKLEISNTNSISIIKKEKNFFKFEKIYYKIEPDDYNFKKEKKLSCIEEEEQNINLE